jgi:predicted PurR-regulated permease PerM
MIYDTWNLASDNLEHVIIKYKDQITDIAGSLFEGVLGMGGSVLQFIFATIIAGILLATKGTDSTARKFFKKLVGARGDEFTDVTETIVRNVTKGVIGVALIQSVLVGLGFLLAGVPYAGLWALLVLILAILQLPPLLVILPVILYLFSTATVLPATLWTVYLLLAGASDNILKPILLGKGAPVPMMVIFLGVIGGFMLSGFIGLFTGAIVISLGYKMFLTWLNDEEEKMETDDNTKSRD